MLPSLYLPTWFLVCLIVIAAAGLLVSWARALCWWRRELQQERDDAKRAYREWAGEQIDKLVAAVAPPCPFDVAGAYDVPRTTPLYDVVNALAPVVMPVLASKLLGKALPAPKTTDASVAEKIAGASAELKEWARQHDLDPELVKFALADGGGFLAKSVEMPCPPTSSPASPAAQEASPAAS